MGSETEELDVEFYLKCYQLKRKQPRGASGYLRDSTGKAVLDTSSVTDTLSHTPSVSSARNHAAQPLSTFSRILCFHPNGDPLEQALLSPSFK